MVGPVPEGMTISNGSMYTTMYKSPHDMRAHIVAYKFKKVPNRYIMQKLPWLPWGQFTRLASKVKIRPYIKLGHGQAFSATHKYIYAIANDHLLRHSSQSEKIMQISKKDLQIKRIWTFKIWNKSAKDGRYMHNATFLNNKFVAVYHSSTKHRFEYWEVTRHGDSWQPVEIGATKGEFMRNNSPVLGIAYDKRRAHTGREFEGICVNNSHLYAELAQRPELLHQKIK